MKLKQIVIAGAALAVIGSVSAEMKPEQEIRYRQSVMNVMGRAFGPMIGMAQDKIPYNKDTVVKNTAIVETLIGLPWNSFAPGTEKGAPTRADLKVWSETAKFKDASEKAQQALGNLSQTVKGGDEKAIRTAIGDLGKACKGCHEEFQLKEPRT